MYKLCITTEENKVTREKTMDYLLQDVSTGKVINADKNITMAMISRGEVLNALLSADNVVLLERDEKETQAELIMQSAIWRTRQRGLNTDMLYVIEETIETKQPVAVVSLDPFRRVLATVVCDRTNATYNKNVNDIILSHNLQLLFNSYKESDGKKKEQTFLGISVYKDTLNYVRLLTFRYDDGSMAHYPCIGEGGAWRKNVKIEIFPKESIERPKDISDELYSLAVCVFRVLEQHMDVYCSPNGDALYFHEYQEE